MSLKPICPEVQATEVQEHEIAQAIVRLQADHPGVDCRRWLELHTCSPGVLPGEAFASGDRSDDLWRLRMIPDGHARFANLIKALERSGAWQVAVSTKVLTLSSWEELGDLDWEKAIRFPTSGSDSRGLHPEGEANIASPVFSATSKSRSYYPYLADVLTREGAKRVFDRVGQDEKHMLLQAPSVTCWHGRDFWFGGFSTSPFVVGVHPVQRENGFAYQPDIVALDEGLILKVTPTVIDESRVELVCHLELSEITEFDTVDLPGLAHEVTVQAPTTRAVSIDTKAVLRPDESLLLAPILTGTNDKESERKVVLLSARWFRDSAPDFSEADE